VRLSNGQQSLPVLTVSGLTFGRISPDCTTCPYLRKALKRADTNKRSLVELVRHLFGTRLAALFMEQPGH
jgi:hypothetical protein